MTDKPLELENPFWRFSLAVYRGEDVSEECFAVQDELGGDVNLLLFCAWLGVARGVQLSEADLSALEQSTAGWNQAATHPLRAVRWAVKGLLTERNPVLSDFRKDVAELELRAEQIAQAMLYAQADRLAAAASDAKSAAANVACYMSRLARASGKAEGNLSVAALIEAATSYGI